MRTGDTDGAGGRQRGGACLGLRGGEGGMPAPGSGLVLLGLVAQAVGTSLPTVGWGLRAAFA